MNEKFDLQERLNVEEILGKGTASVPGWMQRREIKWAAAVLATLLLFSIVWWFTSGTKAVRYVTDPATRGDLTVIVTATGSVQPTKKVDVSSELSGTVRTVLVDYNSVVAAGQTLAELDTEKLEATVNSSRAKLAAAKAKVKDAEATVGEKERDVARKRRLLPGQAISNQDFDQSQAAYERALAAVASTIADVAAAEADLRLNESNLGKASITSPINGVVLKRSVDPGQTVASTLQAPVLFSIAEDLKQMELQVDVDEADVGKVEVGQRANFSVDAFPDRKFPAAIRLIRFASETIQGVVTYKAVLSVDNSELLLRPGMTATAEIIVTLIKDALLVSNAGLRYTPTTADAPESQSLLSRLLPGRPPFRAPSQGEATGRDRTVWVMNNGEPAQVKIEIGSSDGKRTEVQSGGLQVGQAVVIEQTTVKQ